MTTSAPNLSAHPRYVRWTAFLAKIRTRIDEICAETEAGTRALIAQDPTNPQALKTAQQALNQRVENIRRKIEKAWSEEELDRIKPTADGPAVAAPESAYDEWHATERYLSETWTTCKVRCMAEFLRAMWPHVEAALAKPIPCTRCGAALTPSARHTSETVTCAHCQAVNQCIPEPLVYAWFADAPHNLGLEEVLTKRYAVLRAGEDAAQAREAAYRRTGERPPEPLASKQRREAMAREYYVAFAEAKSRVRPAPAEEQSAEVERSMAAFRQSLED